MLKTAALATGLRFYVTATKKIFAKKFAVCPDNRHSFYLPSLTVEEFIFYLLCFFVISISIFPAPVNSCRIR